MNLREIHIYSTTSTQDIAIDLIKNCVNNTLVIADIQTCGRGRLNERVWVSVFGNFHGSFIIDIGNSVQQNAVATLNYVCLEAVRDTIIDVVQNAAVDIKNPNDIMVAGKKIAGVLVEIVFPYAIIGVGLNTKNSPIETATDLCSAFGVDVSNKDVSAIMYRRITERILLK
jgi:BirA family biotin operon repressor/biotin-[acetyl-CoA-carboxylase] ligase